MSSEETNKPSSITIPIDWSKIKNPPYVRTLIEKEIQERNTEDAEFEIIEPKQIEDKK